MRTTTVNISFPSGLLKEIDAQADRDSMNRSDFLRTAVRAFLDRKRRWQRLFVAADAAVASQGFTEQTIKEEIRKSRRTSAGRNASSRS